MLATAAASLPTWPRIAISEEEAVHYNHSQELPVGLIPFSNSMYNRGGDQEFPFLQHKDPKIRQQAAAPEVPNYQPVRVPSKTGRASHELTPSDSAFSLLSFPATQFSGICSSQTVHAIVTPPVQTIGSGLYWFNNLAQLSNTPISPVSDPVEVTKANDHQNTTFHLGSSGLSANEPSCR